MFNNIKQESTDPDSSYSRSYVEDLIQKRFDVNDISDLLEYVEVSGKGSNIIIDMEYERRAPFFSNIELVATFKHYIEFSE